MSAGARQWRKFIRIHMNDVEKFKLHKKINNFFESGETKPLLQIINFIDKSTFDYIAATKVNQRRAFREVYRYCYENYLSSFDGVNKSCPYLFEKSIRDFKFNLPVAGLVLVNRRKQMLLVHEIYHKNKRPNLNFPMGKLDYEDGDDLKKTAVRETKEETGLVLTEDEIKNIKGPIIVENTYRGRTKSVHLYILEGFNRKVDINHKKRGEIGGSAWVHPRQVGVLLLNNKHIAF